jgi:hypothetical protein
MELITLGFDQWFEDKRSEALRPDFTVDRVTAVHKASYLIRNYNSEVLAELAGSFIYSAESFVTEDVRVPASRVVTFFSVIQVT